MPGMRSTAAGACGSLPQADLSLIIDHPSRPVPPLPTSFGPFELDEEARSLTLRGQPQEDLQATVTRRP